MFFYVIVHERVEHLRKKRDERYIDA